MSYLLAQVRSKWWKLVLEEDDSSEAMGVWQLGVTPNLVRAAFDVAARRNGWKASFHDWVANQHVSKSIYMQLAALGKEDVELNKALEALRFLFLDFASAVSAGPNGDFFSRLIKERAAAALCLVNCAVCAAGCDPDVSQPRRPL